MHASRVLPVPTGPHRNSSRPPAPARTKARASSSACRLSPVFRHVDHRASRNSRGTEGAAAATSVSFAEASDWMAELASVAVDPKQVERSAEALGREVAVDERETVEPAPAAAPTMYLGLDGTGVPVRKSDVEGRRGEQPSGSAKTCEVKLATVWTAETRNADGLPERDPGPVSYSAAVESAASRPTDPLPSPFAQPVYREARRPLPHRGAARPHRRRGRVDLESVRRTIPRRHRNRRHLPCQGASVRRSQGHPRRPAQARRHALDRGRRQRHHRPAVLQAQRPLRGLLGTTSRRAA